MLANPADSGRLLQVIGVGASHYSIFSHLLMAFAPDVTGMTPVAAESTNASQPVTPVAVLYAGLIPPPTTPPGVLLTRNLAGSPWNLNETIPGSWVVPPGTSLGFVVYFYASSSPFTFAMVSVMWAEV